jgi:effector-binding domain-containing protein
MSEYEVRVSTALPRHLAAVRRTVRPSGIPSVIRGELGRVWQFLRENTVRSIGHNVALYSGKGELGPDRQIDAWFGVEVHEGIPASEHVIATTTPIGPVASAAHWGEYARLGEAHDAVRAWCQANDRRTTGVSWEVYGDWFDDWAKVHTDVYYLLAD